MNGICDQCHEEAEIELNMCRVCGEMVCERCFDFNADTCHKCMIEENKKPC